jgi:hypothetical protein
MAEIVIPLFLTPPQNSFSACRAVRTRPCSSETQTGDINGHRDPDDCRIRVNRNNCQVTGRARTTGVRFKQQKNVHAGCREFSSYRFLSPFQDFFKMKQSITLEMMVRPSHRSSRCRQGRWHGLLPAGARRVCNYPSPSTMKIMNKVILTLSTSALFALVSNGQLLQWDTADIAGALTGASVPASLASSFNDANIQSASLSAGPGLTAWDPTDPERLQFSGWNAGSDSYLEFTVAAVGGYQLSVSGIEYHYRARGSGTQAHTANIYSSLDGFSSPVGSVAVAGGNAFPGQELSIAITGVTDVTSVTFRLLHEGGDPALETWRPLGLYGNSGTEDIEFSVVGSVTVVPEPSAYALLAGFAMLGFVLIRRRKR